MTTWCECGNSDVIHAEKVENGRRVPAQCLAPGCPCQQFKKAEVDEHAQADERKKSQDQGPRACSCGV